MEEYDDCEWEGYVVVCPRWEDFRDAEVEIDVPAAAEESAEESVEESDEGCHEVLANRLVEPCESPLIKGFRVLKQEDILVRVQDDIAKVSSVLSLPKEAATILLCNCGWNIDTLYDKWFGIENEEKIRKDLGNLIVDQSANCDDLVATYMREGKKKSIRWCPAGCGRAVEILMGKPGGRTYDVACDCKHQFCWNCSEEAHSPVDCETVDRWKNCSESQNMNWVLANCKACPACRRLIESTAAGMQVICPPPCNFEFCWLCLGPWSQHDTIIGGNHACKFYDDVKESGELEEAEKERERARICLEKYRHCYEGWRTHDEWRQIVLLDMHELKAVHLKILSEVQDRSENNLQFIVDAWDQIVECRRMLKWAYVYGYYMPEDDQLKKNFFEYMLEEAEAALERLHHRAQIELQSYLQVPLDDFDGFRLKLFNLTSVTRHYFDNFVGAIENGY